LLGAVTHVDGSARIQVVVRESNLTFWTLISRFGELTGVPVLLNTSFNNNAEPIVQSAEDAIVCFLTTGLEYLVLGDYLVSRKQAATLPYGELAVRLPTSTELAETHSGGERRQLLRRRRQNGATTSVSPVVYDLLSRSDGRTPVESMLDSEQQPESVIDELRELWTRRLVILQPVTHGPVS
jgi:hypothetical protein